MKNNILQLLNDNELSKIRGGEWYYIPGYGYTYLIGEITVVGTYGGCSACRRLSEYQASTGDRLTPVGEWLYNQIVSHDVGCPHR